MISRDILLRTIALGLLAGSVQAASQSDGDYTVNAANSEDGNLTVEGGSLLQGNTEMGGSLDIHGGLTLGETVETIPQPAFGLSYAESGSTYSLTLRTTRVDTAFLWQDNGTGTARTKMKLDASNVLSLYNTSGTATIILNPNSGQVTVGGGQLLTTTDAASTYVPLAGGTLTGSLTFPGNTRQSFSPGATNSGLNVGSVAGTPSSPVNGDIWYDSSAHTYGARANGATTSFALLNAANTWTAAQTAGAGLSFSGNASNIALGSNYLSGDGGDEGIAIDSEGAVTFSRTELHFGSSGNGIEASDYLILYSTSSGVIVASPGGLWVNGGSIATTSNSTITANGWLGEANTVWLASSSLNFEGSTEDAYETTVTLVNPTADRTITLPNASGTVALVENLTSYLPLAGGTLTGNLTFPGNMRQTFSPGATNSGLNVGSVAGTPSSPVNGDIWYNSSAHTYGVRANGATTSIPLLNAANTWTGAQTAGAGLSLSGNNSNIALGANYLSGDGGDEGIAIDSEGLVTFSNYQVHFAGYADCVIDTYDSFSISSNSGSVNIYGLGGVNVASSLYVNGPTSTSSDGTGTITANGSLGQANTTWMDSNSLNFEGSAEDAYETTVTAVNPTADRTITLPNASGTVALVENLTSYLPLAGGTLSSNLTLSGSAANIALGSNYLSGDGTDKGIAVSTSGNVGIGTNTPGEILTIHNNLAKPIIGNNTTHTVLHPTHDTQTNTTLEINNTSATGNGTSQIVLSENNTASNASLGALVFANSGTSAPEKRGAFISSRLAASADSNITADLSFATAVIGTLTTKWQILPGGDWVPATNAAHDIGSASNGIDDLFLGSGGVINFSNGNYTVTHSSGLLTLSGGIALGGAITFPDNVRQIFNPGTTNAGLNVGQQAGDPSSLTNGDIWYDSTANTLDARINGATVNLATTASLATYLPLSGGSLSSNLVLSGSAANVALGANYLSGDGGDEGIAIDSNGMVTFSNPEVRFLNSNYRITASDGLNIYSASGVNMSPLWVGGTINATDTISANGVVDAANATWMGSNSLNFEGSEADAYETKVTAANPTADRTITLPNASGTVATLENAQTWTGNQTFTGTVHIEPQGDISMGEFTN